MPAECAPTNACSGVVARSRATLSGCALPAESTKRPHAVTNNITGHRPQAMADVEVALVPPAAELVAAPVAAPAPASEAEAAAEPAAVASSRAGEPRRAPREPAAPKPGPPPPIYVVRVPRPPPDESSNAAAEEAEKRLSAADAALTAAVADLAAKQARCRAAAVLVRHARGWRACGAAGGVV